MKPCLSTINTPKDKPKVSHDIERVNDGHHHPARYALREIQIPMITIPATNI